MIGTVKAIETHLMEDGFVGRYTEIQRLTASPRRGKFLACSFWLADNYVLQGRHRMRKRLFERLVSVCNDVGAAFRRI